MCFMMRWDKHNITFEIIINIFICPNNIFIPEVEVTGYIYGQIVNKCINSGIATEFNELKHLYNW